MRLLLARFLPRVEKAFGTFKRCELFLHDPLKLWAALAVFQLEFSTHSDEKEPV